MAEAGGPGEGTFQGGPWLISISNNTNIVFYQCENTICLGCQRTLYNTLYND